MKSVILAIGVQYHDIQWITGTIIGTERRTDGIRKSIPLKIHTPIAKSGLGLELPSAGKAGPRDQNID